MHLKRVEIITSSKGKKTVPVQRKKRTVLGGGERGTISTTAVKALSHQKRAQKNERKNTRAKTVKAETNAVSGPEGRGEIGENSGNGKCSQGPKIRNSRESTAQQGES